MYVDRCAVAPYGDDAMSDSPSSDPLSSDPRTGTTQSAVTLQVDGGVAIVTIDDGKANALSHTCWTPSRRRSTRSTAPIRAVVIAGRPGRFSAGFDLSVMTLPARPSLANSSEGRAKSDYGSTSGRCR